MNRYLPVIVLIVLLTASYPGFAWQEDTETPIEAYQKNINGTLSPEVEAHIEAIFEAGQEIGNRANIFSQVGDSLTVSRRFLHPFGIGEYNTGDYDYLETIIPFYSEVNARTGNSFVNQSLAAGEGWSANSALNFNYADEELCTLFEAPLFCEYRLVRPSIAIIMFGTNDAGYRTDYEFKEDMKTIIRYTEGLGIIPVLSTIPNRPDVGDQILLFNDILRELASNYELPLIELYQATASLPNYGLTFDNVHLSSPPDGLSASFDPVNLEYGYTVRNFLTMEMLYTIHQLLND